MKSPFSFPLRGSRWQLKLTIMLLLAAFAFSMYPNITFASSTVDDDVFFAGAQGVLRAFQRKTFYANGRFWVFYTDALDGNAVFQYSTSVDGATWSTPTTVDSGNTAYRYSVWYDGSLMHYVQSGSTGLSYRAGTPNSDGSISWVAPKETVATTFNDTIEPSITVDSSGYVWIGYTDINPSSLYYPYVIRSGNTNGTWGTTPAGFPYELSNNDHMYWRVTVVPRTSGKIAAVYARHDDPSGVHLLPWNGSDWLAEAVTTSIPDKGGSHSAVAKGDTVQLVFMENSSTNIVHTEWSGGPTFGSETTITSAPDSSSDPVLSINPGNNDLFVFWLNPTDDHVYYRRYNDGADTWETIVDWVDESTDEIDYPQVLSGFYQAYGGRIGLAYTTLTQGSSPAQLKFDFLSGYNFYGVYDEDTGLLTNEAVNVTAYFSDGASPETFEVNGSYSFLTTNTLLYFHFNFSTNSRQYWISPTETTTVIYIFNAATTVYTISFLDLAGALDDYPFVEAQRYINGTLRTVEKRRVDVEEKVTMSLINGVKYNLVIQDGSSYTFGDLLMTSTTSITLTLKGIEFPKETLLTYKYVRVYVTRAFATPNGNITVTYDDTLSQTSSVEIFINYRNGTNAYNATETAQSFSHTWASVDNSTDYRVEINIDHQKYGTYTVRQFLPRHLSTNPWGLDFLGTSLPFATNILIPMLIILFVGGSFSVLNAELGAFMAVVAAIVVVYMWGVPIPASYLIVAFTFAICMGVIYAKRKLVQT